MPLIDIILEQPSYGWSDDNGALAKPSRRQLFTEFFSRMNIFRSKKNWLPFLSWAAVFMLLPFVAIFVIYHFNIWLALLGFVYGMVFMGSHGTIWYHRYSTHKAYKFKNNFWRFLTRNLVPTMIPEEIYVISHHVHHVKSDLPGDPYNAQGGWLYCFLADVNHNPVNTNLTESEYATASHMLQHTGVKRNTYAQYQKWGTISNPFYAVLQTVLTIAFWFTVFYLIGGIAVACALMSGACFWAIGVRTFNYDGHGRGKDKRKDGTDFNRKDYSVNQYWPGFVAGEWHNNHHLYPASARCGFLKHQIDFAWYYIYLLYKIGGVASYHDSKKQFMVDYLPVKTK